MNDQARQLREMVLQESLGNAVKATGELTRVRFLPPLQESRAGIALNVSLALARRGVRVAVVVPHDWNWAGQYDCFERLEADTLSSPDLAHASLALGPWGVRLVEGGRGDQIDDRQWALLAELLVDLRPASETSPQPGELQVYLTATDNASLIDTYALIKDRPGQCPALLVAHPAESDAEGREALLRICQASRDRGDPRVLATAVLTQEDSQQLVGGARPPMLTSPKGSLAMRLDAIAERLLAERGVVVDPTVT